MTSEASTTFENAGNSQQQNAIENFVKTMVNPQTQLIIVHLDKENYLIWKFQIVTAIRGYGLEEFILGTLSFQPKFATIKKTKR